MRRTLVPGRALLMPAIALVGSGVIPEARGDDVAFFERRIRPLFIEHCVECHGPVEADVRGGLVLSTPAAIRRGGDGGPVVVPGHPEESSLYLAVSYEDPEFQMPRLQVSYGKDVKL